MRKWAAVLLFVGLISGQLLSGRRAPSFSLPDSTMTQHDLLDYRGKWLLIDFMQTNCPHCKALTKTLEEVKNKYGGKVAILSIVVPPDNMSTVAKYIAENKVTSPIVFDSSQVAVSYFKSTPAHPSFDTPHWFAVDPNGMIEQDWAQASADGKQWVAELDKLVSGKK